MNRLLQKDDVIICHTDGRESGNIGRIDKVTETRAYAGDVKFKREVKLDGILFEIGAERWGAKRYVFGTPEAVEKTKAANRLSRLRNEAIRLCDTASLCCRTVQDAEKVEALMGALKQFIESEQTQKIKQ